MEMQSVPRLVVDTVGRSYELIECIGQGGQGSVHREKTGKFLIKLLRRPDSASRERTRRRLQLVKQLPLDGLPITRPYALLNPPYLGYVMDYLKDMQPISTLRYRSPHDRTIEWYIETGGLQKRIKVLWRLTDVLTRLHGKGLVYGDLSPNNVFVSTSPDKSEVFLIDLDNLTYENNVGEALFTRRYAAPEVFIGRQGHDTLTDAFSFALIAYEMLCQAHPLIGTWVEDSEPEVEDQALAGELPWVGHSTDRRNQTQYGYPADVMLNAALLDLFKRTFEDGLKNRRTRPGLAEWEDALLRASLSLIQCAKCGFDYYDELSVCPNCSTRPSAVYQFRVKNWIAANGEVRTRTLLAGILPIPGQLTVTRRMLGYSGDGANEPLLELTTSPDNSLSVCSLSEGTGDYWLTADWSSADRPVRKRQILARACHAL